MGFSVPSDRNLVCDHPALTRKVGEIIQEWKLPGKMSGGQIVKVGPQGNQYSTRNDSNFFS